MLLRAITRITGPTINIGPGEEFEADELAAQEFIDGGYAVQVGPPRLADLGSLGGSADAPIPSEDEADRPAPSPAKQVKKRA